VPHAQLDPARFAPQVVAQALALARVGFEQAAQHADGCGLAAAVGAQEAADLAAPHLDGDVVDHGASAKALGQAAHVDGELVTHAGCCCKKSTTIGWPCFSECAPSGTDSNMNNNLLGLLLL